MKAKILGSVSDIVKSKDCNNVHKTRDFEDAVVYEDSKADKKATVDRKTLNGFWVSDYEVNENGLYFANGVRISKTPLAPCGILSENDGTYGIRVAYFPRIGDLKTKYVDIPFDTLYQHKKLQGLAKFAIDVNSGNSKKISTYLATLFDNFKEEMPKLAIVNSCGWNERSFIPFDSDCELASKFKSVVAQSIFQRGSLAEWCEGFSMVADNAIARIVLASACCAPLLEQLGLPENLIFNLIGATSNGKSVLLKFAASVWGDSKNTAFFRCANATQMNIESAAALFCDLPVFLDEGETKSWLSSELMQWAQGHTKGRRDRIEVARYRNVFMLSSERSILPSRFNQGLLNRIFEISLEEKLGDDTFIATFVGKFEKNFGMIGPIFIDEVQNRVKRGALMATFEGHFNAIKNGVSDIEMPLSIKIMRVLAAILTADDILCSVLHDVGCDCEAISAKEIIDLYIINRSEDPDEVEFYKLCACCAKSLAPNKNALDKNACGFLDADNQRVYIERNMVENYRSNFVNWLSKQKIEKYGRSYFKPILSRQFLTITDREAVNFFKAAN